MNKGLLLIFLFFQTVFAGTVYGQCPTATIPDTICAGQPFDITNTTPGYAAYYWDFCTGDLNNTPLGTNIGNPGNTLSQSHQIHIVEDGGNYYGFVANFAVNNIVRLDFGNSPGNVPVANNLTVGSLNGPSGIQLLKEANNWYALVQNYWSGDLVRLDFGNSITNASPAVDNLGQNLGSPFHLKFIKDNDSLYVFSASLDIKRFKFGNSITNTPIVEVINDPAFNAPFGIDITYDCVYDKFIGVVANLNNGVVHILDFDNNLQNTPTISTFNTLPLSSPTSVNILKDGSDWHVLITDQSNNLTQLNFSNNLLNPNPIVILNDPIGALSTPRGMQFINHESIWYGNITNWAGSVTQVTFPDLCYTVPAFSDSINPLQIGFTQGGPFNFQLTAKLPEGRGYYFDKSIYVLESPNSNFNYLLNNCDTMAEFYDSSFTNSGIINSWLWNFGDGNTSNSMNPFHSYSMPGLFNVSLTVTTDQGCSSTFIDNVLNEKPKSSFTVDDGCVVPPLVFSNTSPDPQNFITSWFWDFGDSTTSTDENPVHTYINQGNYVVTLIANTGNCSDTTTLSVEYLATPDVQFSVSNTCIGQQQQFNNLSTIASGTITSSSWNFGDGNNSSLFSPLHQYADTGNYNVQLILTASSGCVDTLVETIRVSNLPTADFSYVPSLFCTGSSVSFTDISSVSGDTISHWLWDFANGDTSTLQNPVYQYPVPGVYVVSLSVSAGTDCINSTTQQIEVYPGPVADFSFSNACEGQSINFTDLSISPPTPPGTQISSWHWNFGDGDTSDISDPVHLYQNPGIYDVTLTVTTNTGCLNSYTTQAYVFELPNVNFLVTNNCSQKATQFIDNTDPANNLASWFWDFGDTTTSTIQNPSHFYNSPGIYTVNLTVTSTDNCSNSSSQQVVIHKTPGANFSSSQVCDGEHVSFTYLDNSFPSNATNWYWNFGNGATSINENPANLYLTWGVYFVTLIVADTISGCSDTITKPIEVHPNPVALISSDMPCVGSPFLFTDSSSVATGSIQNWEWVINSEYFNIENPVYIFPDTGQYVVFLKVITDQGCRDSISTIVNVSGLPTADFSFSPTYGDAPLLINFSNSSIGASSYSWHFGDGTTGSGESPTHTFSDTGIFVITMIAINENGCRDSLQKSIYIIQPILDIAIVNLYPVIKNNYLALSAEIYNFGTREVNFFNISTKLGGKQAIQESWTGSLKTAESMIYQFTASLEIVEELNFVCATLSSPNGEPDQNISNNSMCLSFSEKLEILSVFPNPSKDKFTIQFNLNISDHIEIDIYDSKGALIRNLYSGMEEKGFHSLTFSGLEAGLTNGMYLIMLSTSEHSTLTKFSIY